jgi:hypothetical protein
MMTANTNGSVLAGRPPASTKGHFYWLKVAGGCLARQQKPVLAARTNRFWLSARKKVFTWRIKDQAGSLTTNASMEVHDI